MQIFHVKKVSLERVMPFIIDQKYKKKQKENKINIDGFDVYIESLRLFTFKEKGVECVSCGRKGTHFRVQENGREIHLGLWSDDNIQMTKDHIIPRVAGGSDHIDNMQTMCSKCNNKKGHKFKKEDFSNGKGLYSYEEAVEIMKKKKLDNILHPNDFSNSFKSQVKKDLLNKYPQFPEVQKRLKSIRSQKKDPFKNLDDKDVKYALAYLSDLIKVYEGKISKRDNSLNIFPKRLINNERNKYKKDI